MKTNFDGWMWKENKCVKRSTEVFLSENREANLFDTKELCKELCQVECKGKLENLKPKSTIFTRMKKMK